MQITLTATAGPHQGETYTFSDHDTFLVGRSKQAHFQLPRKDMYFSRLHFMLEINPPRCRILDMGSRNGTHVNGKPITAIDLKDGDQIKAGHTILSVAFQDLPMANDPAPRESTLAWTDSPPVAIARPPVSPRLADPVADRPAVSECVVCQATLTLPDEPLCPACKQLAADQPQSIPGYLVVREVGRGGMGVVSLGVREADASLVAIKTIIPAVAANAAEVKRFLREVEILRQLDHPNIVAFREMGEVKGQIFFAMDFVRGSDAGELMKKQGKLERKLAVRIICQVLEALAHAHIRGFVHRDIKPANLLLAEAKGRRRVKVADFGLARVYHASRLSGLTLCGDVGGSLNYLPPEQITNYRLVKPAADQYSTAATLYHLLTGRHVYELPREPHACFLVILQEDVIPIQRREPQIPDGLAAVVQRALAREPDARFANVEDFRKALAPFGN